MNKTKCKRRETTKRGIYVIFLKILTVVNLTLLKHADEVGQTNPEPVNLARMFNGRHFSEDALRELCINYLMCQAWVNNDFTGAENFKEKQNAFF